MFVRERLGADRRAGGPLVCIRRRRRRIQPQLSPRGIQHADNGKRFFRIHKIQECPPSGRLLRNFARFVFLRPVRFFLSAPVITKERIDLPGHRKLKNYIEAVFSNYRYYIPEIPFLQA